MSKTEVVAKNSECKPKMVCSENATHEEKSGGGRALAFSIDSIMSDHGTKSAAGMSPATSRCTSHRIWKTVEDDAMTSEVQISVQSRAARNKPETVSRNDAAVMRYHLHQQQKMKLANAVMLHMATTGNNMATVDKLLPVSAPQPEVLLRHYHQRQPSYQLQSERYHRNAVAANITSFPVTSSFGRCRGGRLPVSPPVVTWPPSSNRGSEYYSFSEDKPKFASSSESLFSPARSATNRKRRLYDGRDVTDWSQMAAESLQQRRQRSSPTGSPRSTISDCSAEEEIIVDDDVNEHHRKQFSPASEKLPVERPEVVNDCGDSSWAERTGHCREQQSSETCLKPSAWSVISISLIYALSLSLNMY